MIEGKKNVKIFILYMMANIDYPMTFSMLNDVIMQTDYVLYIDFVETFYELKDGGFIDVSGADENGDELYVINTKGRLVAQELKSDIRQDILNMSLAAAFRLIDYRLRGLRTSTSIQPEGGRFIVTCTLEEERGKGNTKKVFTTSLEVDSMDRAEAIVSNFTEKADLIYRGFISLLTGEVNFLFENPRFD